VLSRAHGVIPDALRIVAPRGDERQQFAAALESVIRSAQKMESGHSLAG
jgi:hypothetical protein